MKKWKAIGRKLLWPPAWVQVMLVLLSALALAFVFVKGLSEHPLSSIAYVLAFYTLTVVCITCADVLPGSCRRVRQRILTNPYGKRWMTDMAFRANVSLHLSLIINALYVGVNVFTWYINRSVWFIILAAYYGILAVMRYLLVRYVHGVGIGKRMEMEYRRSRLCAVILLLLNFALSGSVLMILYQDRGFAYPGVLIYVMAMYTFYAVINSVRNIIRYRKYQSPVMSMSKVISLAAALVSVLSLETAMLTEFATESTDEFRWIMIVLTGAGISAAVIAMSVYSIVKANKGISELNINISET